METRCRICGALLTSEPNKERYKDFTQYDCERCGQYAIENVFLHGDIIDDYSYHHASVLSHRIRCMYQPEMKTVFVKVKDLASWHLDDALPTPAEKLDKLILWMGEHQEAPWEEISINIPELSAILGDRIRPDVTLSFQELRWLVNQKEAKKFIESTSVTINKNPLYALTFEGWNRYETIKNAEAQSRTAFMAMKFDPELEIVVSKYFKPAVTKTGFELRLLTDGQPAGLIDDQLRVALRTSRFVLADLTHENKGAYWEAGFAEGLGKPVIYTCRKDVWDDFDDNGNRKIHFDTNHLVTIIWDPKDLGDAANKLTATIRATLPGEAKMSD